MHEWRQLVCCASWTAYKHHNYVTETDCLALPMSKRWSNVKRLRITLAPTEIGCPEHSVNLHMEHRCDKSAVEFSGFWSQWMAVVGVTMQVMAKFNVATILKLFIGQCYAHTYKQLNIVCSKIIHTYKSTGHLNKPLAFEMSWTCLTWFFSVLNS
jgi:hypothetical protein